MLTSCSRLHHLNHNTVVKSGWIFKLSPRPCPQVFVVEPESMDFAPCRVEVTVGLVLDLPLRFFGRLEEPGHDRVMLTDCSHYDLQVEEETPGVFQLLDGGFNYPVMNKA